MLDRPIIFSAPMVRALLDGRKTQTRRMAWRDATTDTLTGATYGLRASLWQHVRPGERLWVREAWCPVDDREHGGELWVDYRATPRWPESSVNRAAGWDEAPKEPGALRWRSPIHMPRCASRLTLHVEAARVESLQAISEADAIAEGAEPLLVPPDGGSAPHIEGFRALWDELHGAGSWDANPEVVVLTFRVQRGNIDG